ncbi:HIT-like protein [Dioscorea alata]|uniref:HIT-like protein n=1 Tax=Dioscorea alata TaxID=55571 RepID=A0ACB7UZG6_DIOAL|nr:HIT-like protein [Dioscorea alata]
MLAGVKFIPRDQLQTGKPQQDSGDDSSEEEKNKRGGSGRRKHEERRRSEKRVKKKKSLKKRYSSDEGSSGSSEGESNSFSDQEEEGRRRRRRRKKRDKDLLDDSYSSSDGHEKMKRRRDLKREKKKESRDFEEFSYDDEAREFDARNANELARKEMGLDWMLRSASKTEKKVEEVGEALEKPQVEEVNRANLKELNPYLRNNGSGYPEDSAASESGAGQLLPSSVVGDGGASWRLKALKRAKEQAAREGQNFSEVVKERWGSLSQLAASVDSQRAAPTHAHLQSIRARKRGQTDKPDTVAGNESEKGAEEVRDHSRGYLREVSSRHPEMRKPKHDSLPWKKKKDQPESTSLIAEAFSGLTKFTNDGSFMETFLQSKGASDNSHASVSENDNGDKNVLSANSRDYDASSLANNQVLSANQLAAKILQLRMKGKHDEAEKLSKEMDTMIQQQDIGSKMTQKESNGSTSRYIKHGVSREHKREEDADLHLARKIMGNKKYSLSERADDEYDFDGEPTRKRKHKRDAAPNERTSAKRILTQHERCQFCFENPSRPKHLVISIANFTYMMLPQWQPVVQGHCCILPMQHESAIRTVDKNVLEEIRNFKKCLIRMFANQDKEVVFMETVIGLAKQQRHCLIECVPIPSQLAKQAPLYFKKAIDEAEDEWGQHEMKKLIQTSGNLRNVIPENFAYFHVEFGLDRGFVHVIDDDNNFRSNFGLNVIRGLLKLPEEDMHRRRRSEPLENQRQAAANFARDWEPFDWTKQLD